MNHEQAEWVLKALANQTAVLERIAAAVEAMAARQTVIPHMAFVPHPSTQAPVVSYAGPIKLDPKRTR